MATTNEKAGKLVLVTGAAGTIGRPVCRELLARGHRVRAFDRATGEDASEWIAGSVEDGKALEEAAGGVDAIVHLAATPTDADFFEELLPNNIIGTHNVFEAARRAGVKRMVATSSVQAVDGLSGAGKTVHIGEGTAPRNHYAVTKVFAEQIGHMYAHRFKMSVIVVRPGWVPRELPKTIPKEVNGYLSPRDAGRFFAACVESEKPASPGLEILFAISRGGDPPPYDLEPARRVIGYEPNDIWPEGLCVGE